ncbi:dTMP kinase [candidate division CPR3 bacterium GWF2_35_18]|uniref:Thymidylate kinase n=1 Tax=candidate division CPR3 bacterium GW2011_GWF2_35_18 TaxID=1618350 RepID=A0A0G0BIY0_UNCC3|nr:MAG: putative thymidylate kinase [candidate division CPR3 bacterium GW2011_GWF2_35_18]KKP86778.1 MAG: putative thymidylate kinase [candidate division CPR3 bacterium GW2011_GWE2_35_7]OGB62923.1 MAG: dTMP kinase [candidate division CPR3 bacterium GWF2_35_18]OGB65951.1 MAG: dTMP kinase [candidate division CPR3 bacterium RIFOXYA2_FULL_35_13]OGB76821.1 MAG: dTMP kinase [candidate division CPR3 bacterium RIFOXYC2_FULL_35_7]OGB78512.1 MAG: dTMP kinase [candidate division CPR3 bacterium RIFOXYB2_FU
MFFVIEGIDGAGCGAQRKNLEKLANISGKEIVTMKYPYYDNALGEVLRKFLKEGKDLSVEMQFLLFAGQMISEKEKIAKLRKEKIIVCDRYFAGTLVYQGLKGFDWQKGLRFANDFHLEIPDTIFYLDTPVDVARERKQQEEGKKILDRHEADFEFTKKVDQKYRELIKKKVFAKWIMIDNTKTIDEVTENIVNITNKLIEGGRNTK